MDRRFSLDAELQVNRETTFNKHNGVICRARSFTRVKKGESSKANDDGSAINEECRAFAIADGATMASFSNLWAKVLVRRFVALSTKWPDDVLRSELSKNHIRALSQIWHRKVPWKKIENSWILTQKAQMGASATFLGLRIYQAHWTAFCIGDCNLFVADEKMNVVCSWPYKTPDSFGNQPQLLHTVPGEEEDFGLSSLMSVSSELNPKHWFLMATDAVAHFVLASESPSEQLSKLSQIQNTEEFELWLGEAENLGLRNDDCTIVRVLQETA